MADQNPLPREPARIRYLPEAALAGLAGFVLAVALAHDMQPGHDPLTVAVSYYVHGDHGWLITAALLALGLASLALTLSSRLLPDGPDARRGRWLLALWTAGVLLGGIFPADPPGRWNEPPSLSGLIHGSVAMIAFLAFPFAARLLSRALLNDPRCLPHAPRLRILAIASALTLLLFAASLAPVFIRPGPAVLLGLTERLLLAVYVAWLAALALGLRRAGMV